jgi:raffinose/stachyose/melibiose transport system substrate-binding protein
MKALKWIFTALFVGTGVLGAFSLAEPSPLTASSHFLARQENPIVIEFWHIQGASGEWYDPNVPGNWGPEADVTPEPDASDIEPQKRGNDGNLLFIDDSITRFEADHPGIKISATAHVNDAYKAEIVNALKAGEAPCVFATWGGGPLRELTQAGYVVDLTDLMNQNNYAARFVAGSLENVTFEHRIWGVPVENVSVAVIFYNKTVFSALGLSQPYTFDDLLTIVDRLVEKGYIPFALANETGWPGSMHYMYLVDRLGGPEVFESAANRTDGSFEEPVFVEAGEMLQTLVQHGAFGEGFSFNARNYDKAHSRAQMYPSTEKATDIDSYRGKAVMELMGTWNFTLVQTESPGFFKNMGFFPYPAITGGDGDPRNLIGSVGDMYYHVSATCPHPQEAFEFIQYLIDEQALAERDKFHRLSPVTGLQTDDMPALAVKTLVDRAPHVQLWYDQYLPTELGNKHKDLVRALLELTISPQDAARQMEEATTEYYSR